MAMTAPVILVIQISVRIFTYFLKWLTPQLKKNQ